MTGQQKNIIRLYVLAMIIGIMGLFVVSLATQFQTIVFVCAVGVYVSCFAVYCILERGKYNGDPLLMPLTICLLGIGLTELLRLNPKLFVYQAVWIIIGIVTFCLTVFLFRISEKLVEYKYIFGIGAGLLLTLAILFGTNIGGNQNWVVIGPTRFQPSEFAKIFLVLFFAGYLYEHREMMAFSEVKVGPIVMPKMKFFAPLLIVWGFSMLMLIQQRDLGAALLYYVTALVMIYAATGRSDYFWSGMLLFVIGACICYFLFPHVQTRINIWINPWQDADGKGYQIVQALFAMGTGGILGTGLTYGYPGLIPEVHTDFIFAAIGEEFGYTGSFLVLLLYFIIIYRFFSIALSVKNTYHILIVVGLAAFFSLQVILIIGGVSNLLPLTGITLPFISYGGSSMVANFILLGMTYAISRKGPLNAYSN